VRRARFSVDEVVRLTLGFYRRNCIEGLFLSSGIIRSPDYTMEQVVRVARVLRTEHGFRGYIHLKTIPDAAPELLAEAGCFADRLSINVELPTEASLHGLAPDKNAGSIRRSMARMRLRIDAARDRGAPRFAPAGQSTQVIVGADATPDATILGMSTNLYGAYGLRRVYYSAFSPIPDACAALPPRPAPLLREHRLYQADWLLRFYGFGLDDMPVEADGNLPLDVDPKLAWALAHRESFPVDVNRAPKEALLRIPGMGVKSAARVIAARRHRRLRLDDLARLGVSVAKLAAFVITADHTPGSALDSGRLRSRLAPPPRQLELI
jgi:putative DNA modification/repair radical SAM protein